MKIIVTLAACLFFNSVIAQTTVESKRYGTLQFVELDHGLAKVVGREVEASDKTPTGTHGWLEDFVIVDVTDSIRVLPQANFGVVYMVKAIDTVEIDVDIEWIYPEKITNEKGKGFTSIKYTTKRPTNIPSASSYNLDAPYEMVRGNWAMNIYLENKKVYSKTFFLY